MLEEKRFIDGIWDKYDFYLNNEKSRDVFFKKHYYKNTDYLLALRTVAMFIIVIMFTMTLIGGAYAGIKYYNDNIVQKELELQPKESIELGEYFSNMTYSKESNLYYKKINTYEDYLKAKDVWNGLVEMSDEEFNQNFIVIIDAPNIDRRGMYIENITVNDNTTIIDINKNKENETSLVSVKISREMERDNIQLNFVEKIPNMIGYESLDNLPEIYEKSQALKDNCVVIENNKFISDDSRLNRFIEETQKGKEECIRVVVYFNEEIQISDIEYKNGKYIAVTDTSRNNNSVKNRYYIDGDKFEISETKTEKMNIQSYIIEEKYYNEEDINSKKILNNNMQMCICDVIEYFN